MDSRQDWNNASRGNVQVSTGKASRIRVTTMIGNHNYLLADYADVQGKRTLEFDIPKGITDITVSDGTNNYDTKVGGSVDFGSRSRAAITDGTDPFITVEDMTGNEFRDQWMVVPWIDATRFTRKMPEKCYNANREGVSTDFMFEAGDKDIIIYPLFWQTSSSHIFGLYYIDDNNTIVHVPVWNMGAEKNASSWSSDLVYNIVKSDVQKVELKEGSEAFKAAFGDKKLADLPVKDNVTEPRFGNDVLADISEMTNALVPVIQADANAKGIKANYLYRWTNKNLDGEK